MSKKPKAPSRALTVPQRGTALANPQDLIDKAEAFANAAISPKTQEDYARCWSKFEGFCGSNGLPSLPTSPQALILFFTWLGAGQPGRGDASTQWPDGYVISKSTISQMFSAIKYQHRIKGYPLSDLMREGSNDPKERMAWAELRRSMDGIRRTIGQSRSVRRVDPLEEEVLRDTIRLMRPDVLPEARDAALLAAGYFRRRSEVVGLDYQKRTKGRGTLTVTPAGIVIKLMVSKTNQAGEEEEYITPREHAALLCQTIEHWIKIARIKPGDPVFPRIEGGHTKKGMRLSRDRPQSGYPGITWEQTKAGKGGWVAKDDKKQRLGKYDTVEAAYAAQRAATGAEWQPPWTGYIIEGSRLTGRTVARIVKARVRDYLKSQHGKRLRPEQQEAITAKVARMSGHSLRAGGITSAAKRGARPDQITTMSGHKPGSAMLGVYTRPTNRIEESPFKNMKL